MQPDQFQPMRKLDARRMPSLAIELRGHRITVEYVEHELAHGSDPAETLVAIARPQDAFDDLADHGKPERIGAPARLLDRIEERRLAEQHLGVMAGARAAIFVDALLHHEGRLPVDEIGQRLRIADRRAPAKEIKEAQLILQATQEAHTATGRRTANDTGLRGNP